MSEWPKKVPTLTTEQQVIKQDWIKYWLSTYGKKLSFVEKFNHSYAMNKGFYPNCKTLEIGAGLGDHLKYENFNLQEYTAIEIVPEYAQIIKEKYPSIYVVTEDCQNRLPFKNNYFDRILAIHVLEHLPNLPKALDEFIRILKDNGSFVVVLPCEGGDIYTCARQISSKRMFEKRYHQNYDWLIQSDHLSSASEVLIELKSKFEIIDMCYFPFHIPSIHLNLCIGVTMKKRSPYKGLNE